MSKTTKYVILYSVFLLCQKLLQNINMQAGKKQLTSALLGERDREGEAACGVERCCMEIHGDPLDLQMEIIVVFWETGNDKVMKRWNEVWPVSNGISSKDSSSSFDWFMCQHHHQKALGLIPVWVFSWYSRFLPSSKNMHIKVFEDAELLLGVSCVGVQPTTGDLLLLM